MTCPNPFDLIQSSQFSTAESNNTQCSWSTYLQSDAASLDSTSYFQEKCMNQSSSDTAMFCPLLDRYCNSTEFVFASELLLMICSLYPNMTCNVFRTNTIQSSATIDNAQQDSVRQHAFELSSIVSTGLLSFCAMIPVCSRSAACSTRYLLTIEGQLSSQGIARCWDEICNTYVASINPDFGGLGVRPLDQRNCSLR